jgi:glycosyltransferase involved in cell wall biosynthesis
MRCLCIVPAHNEAACLPPLLDEIRSAGYDAVVIDDASSDQTAAAAAAAGAMVVCLPVNLGCGGAVQTGFLYALRHGYDVVVQVDGDGQHDPRFIGAVLAPIEANRADCVIGSRYLPEAPDLDYETPFARRLGMHLSATLLRAATGLRISDTTSGLRALNRSAFSFFAHSYPTDHPEAEALLMLHQAGFRILEVPVKMRSRRTGQSLFTLLPAALYPLRVVIGFLGLIAKRPVRYDL